MNEIRRISEDVSALKAEMAIEPMQSRSYLNDIAGPLANMFMDADEMLGVQRKATTRQAQDSRGMVYERTGRQGVVRKSPKLKGRDRRLARRLAKQIGG